jgi:hypothetical protein
MVTVAPAVFILRISVCHDFGLVAGARNTFGRLCVLEGVLPQKFAVSENCRMARMIVPWSVSASK